MDGTFLLASPERGGTEWAYVASSRHRIDLRVYVSTDDPERAAHALAATWERRQAKHLASERLGAAEVVGPPERERVTPVRASAPMRRTAPEIPASLLFAERDALAEQLARGGPPLRGHEVRDLEEKLAAITRRRAELVGLGERVAARFQELGSLRLVRSENRDEPRMLRARLADFAPSSAETRRARGAAA